jgi:hypothetical protein
MRVFSSVVLIGIVVLTWSSGTATAQYQTEQEREAERLRLPTHDFPAVPIEVVADVIVVLKPHAAFPLHLPAPIDRFVYGDIVRIEKGVQPTVIVHKRNSFVTPLQAGVPRKLFLKAFPDGSGHYIIGNFPEWYGDKP